MQSAGSLCDSYCLFLYICIVYKCASDEWRWWNWKFNVKAMKTPGCTNIKSIICVTRRYLYAQANMIHTLFTGRYFHMADFFCFPLLRQILRFKSTDNKYCLFGHISNLQVSKYLWRLFSGSRIMSQTQLRDKKLILVFNKDP